MASVQPDMFAAPTMSFRLLGRLCINMYKQNGINQQTDSSFEKLGSLKFETLCPAELCCFENVQHSKACQVDRPAPWTSTCQNYSESSHDFCVRIQGYKMVVVEVH